MHNTHAQILQTDLLYTVLTVCRPTVFVCVMGIFTHNRITSVNTTDVNKPCLQTNPWDKFYNSTQ